MTDFDQQSPEQHRARYVELRRTARARAHNPPPCPPPPALTDSDVIRRETIPGGWYNAFRVARGQALRLVNTAGNPGVSVLLWNADDTSERYNLGDALKLQWTARLGAGRLLFSDMGRVLASITADSGAPSDALLGGSTAASNARQYGDATLRSTAANFRLAAGKLGMGVRDVPPCLTFFAGVGVDADGGFRWQDAATKPGDSVDLRAEMNLLVAVSNCPHPLAPAPFAPGPVEVVLWTPPPAAEDDVCRNFGEEAARGFENTAALFA
jgi:hypothetical protein